MGNGLDIAIIVSGGVATYLGWRLGMIRVGMALIGVAAGIVLGLYNGAGVAPYAAQVVGDGKLADGLGFMAVFLGVFVASVFLGTMIQRVLGMVFLGWLDGTVGPVLGLLVLLGLWSIGLYLVGPSLGDDFIRSLDNTVVAGTMRREAPLLLNAVPDFVKRYAVSPIQDLSAGVVFPSSQ